jgi:hypothetical protein
VTAIPRLVPFRVAVTLAAVPLIIGASRAALHCDEINVLRHVTYFAAGDFGHSSRPGLLWFLLLPLSLLSDPVAILLGGRVLSVLASLGTLLLLGKLALGEGDDPRAPWRAAAAVLLLGTCMNWQGHSFELRTDTFVVPLGLLLLLRLLRPEIGRRDAVIAGALLAAMALCSQKSVYNAGGTLLAVLVWDGVQGRWPGRARLRQAVVSALVAAVLIGLWYGAMSVLTERGATYVGANLKSAAHTAWNARPPTREQLRTMADSVALGPHFWLAAPVGLLLALPRRWSSPRTLAAGVVGIVLLSTITVHRGFFMYFVASMEPYFALAAGHLVAIPCAALARRWGGWSGLVPLGVGLALGAGTVMEKAPPVWATSMAPHLRYLRAVVELFPEPVPYWDMLGTVPGYEEVSFFGTAPSREAFRSRRGKNPFIQLARERKPHFFVREYMSRDRYLKPAERSWIWRHYLPMRPNIYVAGGRIRVTEGSHDVEFLIPGTYTVWFRGGWQGAATVDGVPVEPRAIIELPAGPHRLSAQVTAGSGELWLVLGRDRVPESQDDAGIRDYSMFPLLDRARFQQYDGAKKEGDLLTPPEDPTVDPAGDRSRAKQHARWQEKRNLQLANGAK